MQALAEAAAVGGLHADTQFHKIESLSAEQLEALPHLKVYNEMKQRGTDFEIGSAEAPRVAGIDFGAVTPPTGTKPTPG